MAYKSKTKSRTSQNILEVLSNKTTIRKIHMGLEILLCVLFAVGMFPTIFYHFWFFSLIVIITAVVLSAMFHGKILKYDIVSLAMVPISLIPILGWIALIIGIISTAIAATQLK